MLDNDKIDDREIESERHNELMSLEITLFHQLPLMICSKTGFGAFGSMSLYACHTLGIVVVLVQRVSRHVVRSSHKARRLPSGERRGQVGY
jgi:hypothetical protein